MPSSIKRKSAVQSEMHIDFSDPDTLAKRYSIYQQLLQEAPVYWYARENGWLITRYEDVKACLQDPAISAGFVYGESLSTEFPDYRDRIHSTTWFERNFLVYMNPPEHTHIRRNIQPGYISQNLASMRAKIEQIVDVLLAKIARKQNIDLAEDFSFPLAANVLAELLGIEAEKFDLIQNWQATHAYLLHQCYGVDEATFNKAIERHEETSKAIEEYLTSIIDARRQEPRDDLVSQWLEAQKGRDGLTDRQLIANFLVQYVAGIFTSRDTILCGTMLLMRHPEQLAELHKDPSLIPSAIDEIYRCESPVQVTKRQATKDMELHGQHIKAGDALLICLGAANRDPNVFPEPDVFDIHREPNPHLAFGYGPHHCIGRPLGKMEAEIAFAKLVPELRNMELALPIDKIEVSLALADRSMKALPLMRR